jgi:hypothetical protein
VFRLSATVGLVAAAVIVVGTAEASPSAVRWFHSPSGNIECEVASNDTRGTYAYCQTFNPPRTARLTRSGHTSVCSRNCSIGNGPDNATLLRYGRALRVGVFRCTSSLVGIRCVVAASGRGFRIAREGVTTF